jgi:hypothetical protein
VLPRLRLQKVSRSYRWLLPMMVVSTTALANVVRRGKESLQVSVKRFFECRQCGHPVNLLRNDLCERCGAARPVKLDISPSVLVTAVGCELALLLAQVL